MGEGKNFFSREKKFFPSPTFLHEAIDEFDHEFHPGIGFSDPGGEFPVQIFQLFRIVAWNEQMEVKLQGT